MSDKKIGNSIVSRTSVAAVDWKAEIEAIAGPSRLRENEKSLFSRVARKAAVQPWHIRALFKGELSDPKFSVASKILSAAERARIEAARLDAEALSTRFELIAEGLRHAGNPDKYRADIDALLGAARYLRGLDRT